VNIISENEDERLAFIRILNILDTPIEKRFERIIKLARSAFGAPIAGLSIVDKDRVWFKSILGSDIYETPREGSFCTYTIMQDAPFVVRGANEDNRFTKNRLVSNNKPVNFYAGAPLAITKGIRVGALCIFDIEPRDMARDDILILEDFAFLASNEIKARMMESMNLG